MVGFGTNLYEVKEYCPLLCCPEVDLKPLSPFGHKLDICLPGMKQNDEKMLTFEFFLEEDAWLGKIIMRCKIVLSAAFLPRGRFESPFSICP